MKTSFRILDAALNLSGPDEVLGPIRAAYARFAVPLDSEAGATTIEVPDDGARDSILVDGRPVPIVLGVDATIQVYQAFLATLMDRVAAYAMLHAAALEDRNGGVLLLAAPAGYGKSSLSLGLAERGYRFLGDDYAPLHLADRTVHPYPRAVAILPDGTAPIPRQFLEQSRDPSATRLFGKALLDVGTVLGGDRVCTEPHPLRHVLLLGAGEAPERTLLDVAVHGDEAERFEKAFDQTAGVEIVTRVEQPHMRIWRLELVHAQRPTEVLAPLLDNDHVVLCEKHWDHRADFGGTPEVTPVKRRLAAEVLGRELLNRRGSGRLMQSYERKLPRLFLDLVGALSEANCWSLTPGRYDETLDLIERTVEPRD